MRTSGVVAVVMAVAAGAPAAAVADESVQATGSITYTWQGSPSLGCAAVGVCDVQGALIVEAQGGADVQGLGERSIINFQSSSSTVRVLTGTGQSASECVDGVPNLGGLSVVVSRSGGRLVGAIQPSISSGRCAGPLASDLLGVTLPVRKTAGRHPSFDLRTSQAFTAGPFAGAVVSTVMLRPAVSGFGSSSSSSSSGSFLPGSTRHKVLIEHVSLRYRVTGRPGPLTVSFAGQSDPFCAVLDSCGAGGDVSLSAPSFAGTLILQGSRQVPRPADARQVMADVKHGRISLLGELSSQLETSETFTPANGSRCQDSATNPAALLIGGFPPAGAKTAALTVPGPEVDVLRTHCPGPSSADVFGPNGNVPLARGPIDFAHLLAPHSTLTLGAQGGFSGLGYAGSRGGGVAFSLSLVRVRAGTSEETR